jgi:hypothetical protein
MNPRQFVEHQEHEQNEAEIDVASHCKNGCKEHRCRKPHGRGQKKILGDEQVWPDYDEHAVGKKDVRSGFECVDTAKEDAVGKDVCGGDGVAASAQRLEPSGGEGGKQHEIHDDFSEKRHDNKQGVGEDKAVPYHVDAAEPDGGKWRDTSKLEATVGDGQLIRLLLSRIAESQRDPVEVITGAVTCPRFPLEELPELWSHRET